MKFKHLLFSLLFLVGILNAQGKDLAAQQDTIKGLIFSEVFIGGGWSGYWEITNMEDDTINLGQIEFGIMVPWGNLGESWDPGSYHMMLPDYDLAPGESYVIALCHDFNPEQFAKGSYDHLEKVTRDSIWALADLQIHLEENLSIPGLDSVTPGAQFMGDIWGGSKCFFLRQHISETDSVVIDQVGGVFDEDGKNGSHPYDVAGVTDATLHDVLVRKYSVKTGNLDFASARGIGEDDSEWIVAGRWEDSNFWRDVFWTLGNHGNYVLNENTLESDVATVDFDTKTITVPWGTRRADDIMHLMKYKPGIAWEYIVSPNPEDSLSIRAHTGDKIKITVCGNIATRAVFDIIVSDPTPDAKIVVPKSNKDPQGFWRMDNEYGMITWPRVTRHESGMDTIWGARGGIPYATRVDSLLKRLEKPSNATWEIVWVDGVDVRADLKDGDILRVTAADGSTKDYYISVLPVLPSHDATLSSITWPDIPEDYRGLYGWVGDTIPGFAAEVYQYKIQVPYAYNNIPALVAKTTDPNAKVTVKRASSLVGPLAGRTITFTVQAEDDTTFRVYSIELIKEEDPSKQQPFYGEPFLSEHLENEQWGNSFKEIYNPGNQPLDLSNYMMVEVWGGTNPADVIQSRMNPEDWPMRFNKYIPGYKWVDEQTWQSSPGIVVQDLNVNPIVQPGDVFVMGAITYLGELYSQTDADNYTNVILSQLDVQFLNTTSEFLTVSNPWGEDVDNGGTPVWNWLNGNFFIFKILNDSIKAGLKPANDPNDFELIENFGMADGSNLVIGGEPIAPNMDYKRKPNVFKGNPEYEGSFGTNADNSEWISHSAWDADLSSYGYPGSMIMNGADLGKHFMNTPTFYMSTISSLAYKVSEGYSLDEKILGVVTGTTATQFLSNIFKKDENQTLTLVSSVDGSELNGDDVLNNSDTLVVLSADSVNTTKYVLSVTDEGLSSDAILTSSEYTINVQTDSGTIEGMEFGIPLATVVANVTVPTGARLEIIDDEGAYVPLRMVNYDSNYVDVTVTDKFYFEVTAEDGKTKITYQLLPEMVDTAAYLISYVYDVIQDALLIQYIPRGTNVQSFLQNLIPSRGATLMLVDKYGMERIDGSVAEDDKVVVTSPDGTVTTTYYLAFLKEKYYTPAASLAYILSDVYEIDQVLFEVDGVSSTETVADFLTNITVSQGASAVVTDSTGTEKTADEHITGTDIVQVTAANGRKVTYIFGLILGKKPVGISGITLYPNPTSGLINIRGLKPGNQIRVYNIIGSVIMDIKVENSTETVSINQEPAGIYLVEIRAGYELLDRFKVIKK